jgi:Tat protein translocase TatB subunit
MFDISIWELLLVVFIALLVIGPKQIPVVAFKLGQWIRYLKNAWYALSSELRQQMQSELETPSVKDDPCNKPPE